MSYLIPKSEKDMHEVIAHMAKRRTELEKRRVRDGISRSSTGHDKAEEIACYIRAYFEAVEKAEEDLV